MRPNSRNHVRNGGSFPGSGDVRRSSNAGRVIRANGHSSLFAPLTRTTRSHTSAVGASSVDATSTLIGISEGCSALQFCATQRRSSGLVPSSDGCRAYRFAGIPSGSSEWSPCHWWGQSQSIGRKPALLHENRRYGARAQPPLAGSSRDQTRATGMPFHRAAAASATSANMPSVKSVSIGASRQSRTDNPAERNASRYVLCRWG